MGNNFRVKKINGKTCIQTALLAELFGGNTENARILGERRMPESRSRLVGFAGCDCLAD